MRMSGNAAAAGDYLAEEAVRLKDPVLFLDAADAYKLAGEEARDVAPVQKAMEQALVANDMLSFLADDRASNRWQPVSADHREALLSRTDTLIAQCEILIDEINAEQAAPAEEPVEEQKKRSGKGIGLIAAGAGLGVVGLAGLGLGVAGLGIGSNAQTQVDDSTVYGPDFDTWDEKGKRGNLLAYVGLPLAAIGLGGGIALIILGVKKRRAAGDDPDTPLDEEDSFARSLRVSPSTGGAVLSGRF